MDVEPANDTQSQICFVDCTLDFAVSDVLFFGFFGLMAEPGNRFASTSLSIYALGLAIESVRYFSTIKLAIGADQVAPKPAFSTTTAIAILGLFRGAKATNTEWSFP